MPFSTPLTRRPSTSLAFGRIAGAGRVSAGAKAAKVKNKKAAQRAFERLRSIMKPAWYTFRGQDRLASVSRAPLTLGR